MVFSLYKGEFKVARVDAIYGMAVALWAMCLLPEPRGRQRGEGTKGVGVVQMEGER